MLKATWPYIKHIVHRLFLKALTLGFPEIWKKAEVIFIPKIGKNTTSFKK